MWLSCSRAARISILCSILRLQPPRSLQNSIIIFITWAFGGFWLALFATKCWICGRDTSLVTYCDFGYSFGIIKLLGEWLLKSIGPVMCSINCRWCSGWHPACHHPTAYILEFKTTKDSAPYDHCSIYWRLLYYYYQRGACIYSGH